MHFQCLIEAKDEYAMLVIVEFETQGASDECSMNSDGQTVHKLRRHVQTVSTKELFGSGGLYGSKTERSIHNSTSVVAGGGDSEQE